MAVRTLDEKIKKCQADLERLEARLGKQKQILKKLEEEKQNRLIHDRIERNEKIITLLEAKLGEQITEDVINDLLG